MRRSLAICVSAFLVFVVAPRPAYAWWDYIEQFSGPGPWKGFDVEARLICLVEGDRPRFLATAGMIVSACGLADKQKRRASLDLGMRFVWTHDADFASGERISLTTLEPAFTWSLISGTTRDYVDYGIGAGAYWISSRQFRSLRGAFLEPVRLDVHGPTDCDRANPLCWLVGRFSLLVFPGGFEPEAFLPTTPAARRRISRDWVRAYGIFIDGDRLFRN